MSVIVAFLALLVALVKVLFGILAICIAAVVLIGICCIWGAVFIACNQIKAQLKTQRLEAKASVS